MSFPLLSLTRAERNAGALLGSFQATVTIRASLPEIAEARRYYVGRTLSKWYALQHRFWSVVTGADIPLNCQLGGGLLIPHPNGIVIHPGAKIGPNCLIFQQVTIVGGVKIGGHVDIGAGAGAKIIRPVTIGIHILIGANAVVLADIPDGKTVVGIPAQQPIASFKQQ